MAALVAGHPRLHVTINLTPVLLRQIEDYAERDATDGALELTLRVAETLEPAERDRVLARFFDAHWHNQIFPHTRYKELFARRQEGRSFNDQDVRDLQMWFNLAWFAKEFREGDVTLATGETVSVRCFVERQRDFTVADVEAMVAEQYKILRAIVPLHRMLQERGQVEISTTPFYHPILPLLVDTDRATIDRPGARHPPRFAYAEDAAAQLRLAVAHYRRCFGRDPRGMWPAEGAVAQFVVPLFAGAGARWIATDRGVLARSGRWGYRAEDPLIEPAEHVAEVKEGRAELNKAARDPRVLEAALLRFGCCDLEEVDPVVDGLLRTGEAPTRHGHRIRLVAFGSTVPVALQAGAGAYTAITLGHVVAFLRGHLRGTWDVVRHAQVSDPALGFLSLLEKAEREEEP